MVLFLSLTELNRRLMNNDQHVNSH